MKLFNSVNYRSLAVHGSFNKLVNTRFKRLALLQIATGSFVKTLICWIAVLKMNKTHISGFELLVKALYVSRRVEEKNNKPSKTPKKSKSKNTNPKEYFSQERAALYQVIFPKSHSIPLHFTPPDSSHGLHGSCLLWMQAAFCFLVGIPFTGLRFLMSQCVPLDLGLETSCQKIT